MNNHDRRGVIRHPDGRFVSPLRTRTTEQSPPRKSRMTPAPPWTARPAAAARRRPRWLSARSAVLLRDAAPPARDGTTRAQGPADVGRLPLASTLVMRRHRSRRKPPSIHPGYALEKPPRSAVSSTARQSAPSVVEAP